MIALKSLVEGCRTTTKAYTIFSKEGFSTLQVLLSEDYMYAVGLAFFFEWGTAS